MDGCDNRGQKEIRQDSMSMWDKRYASDDFAYGTEPNVFLSQNAKILTGPVLIRIGDSK